MADDGLPHPGGRAVLRGHVLPARAAPRPPGAWQLLLAVAEAWRDWRDDVARQAQRLVATVGGAASVVASAEPLTACSRKLKRAVSRTFEPGFGGFGCAPKFPPGSTIEFLLRRDSDLAMEMVEKTPTGWRPAACTTSSAAAYRYSVDDRWLIPHFEKMLYDNAQLAYVYLHAWAVSGVPRWRRVVEETLDYVVDELAPPGGGLASAQDADTDGVEGLTFTWNEREAAHGGIPRSCCSRSSTTASCSGVRSSPSCANASVRSALRGPSPASTTRRSPLERPRAGRARRGGLPPRAPRLARCLGRVAEFLLGPLSGEDGRLLVAGRPHERAGLPRRLRERRPRPARAPRCDG